ncbi:MAG: hypothetical protein AAFR59_10060 [Bacteroidota bacterium]
MKNIKYIIPFLALSFIFFACDDGKKQVSELRDQVMDVHDEAMAHIIDMKIMKKNLEKQLEMGNADGTLDSAMTVQLHTGIEALEKADDHMMQWMRNFEAPDNLPTDEALAYLNDQLKDIQLVNEEVNESMAIAKPLVKEIPEEKENTDEENNQE